MTKQESVGKQVTVDLLSPNFNVHSLQDYLFLTPICVYAVKSKTEGGKNSHGFESLTLPKTVRPQGKAKDPAILLGPSQAIFSYRQVVAFQCPVACVLYISNVKNMLIPCAKLTCHCHSTPLLLQMYSLPCSSLASLIPNGLYFFSFFNHHCIFSASSNG